MIQFYCGMVDHSEHLRCSKCTFLVKYPALDFFPFAYHLEKAQSAQI